TQDLCDASTGTCLGTQPTNCDDGNPCTDDSCDPVGGCQHVQVSCDDGNVCTTDSCDPVRGCQHVQVSCDDGSLCTLDSCDPATGACLHRFDPNQSDLDVDGVPDACDDCPTVFNPGQDPNACKEEIVDISIGFGSPLGGGSGMVGWRTTHEVTLTGFNIVVLGRDGGTTRLNQAPIPCTACGTGNGTTYNYPIPKHKSGRNIFIEMLRADVVLGTFGPAVKQ
ncbi:MAG TPA: hypothetical protein VFT43_05155, partial [Candidatus Polarisedimenticolia bacterium]|nr:hypothetical protein [Candidatus Polarisedimenticolia bacterium]